MEQPCDETGSGCKWTWCCDFCSDMYCTECYRNRDWVLKQYEKENDETVLTE